MHLNSDYWKAQLRELSERIKVFAVQHNDSPYAADMFERDIMHAAFGVRVLIERKKLTEEMLMGKVDLEAYVKKVGKPVTWMNSHKFDELYDMSSVKNVTVTMLFLCNQIIHSYTLVPVEVGMSFPRLLVCSDYERNNKLFSVSTSVFAALVASVASDYDIRTEAVFDKRVGDYIIKRYRNVNGA